MRGPEAPGELPFIHIFLRQIFASNYGIFARCGVISHHAKPDDPVIFSQYTRFSNKLALFFQI
jgi:hypothetical protein